ncbi:MAG: GntR family transcriptional regulator [Nocardioidaceae bacterium]
MTTHAPQADDAAGPSSDPAEALRRYLPPGTARGRTTDAVTDAMREAILDGVLAPSTWLREDLLAGAFEVSRTPVREALRRLADEGLAVKTAHHGTVVAPLSLEDVLALYVVRENLEGLAARLAAVRCPPGLVQELDGIQAEMATSAADADTAALARQNLTFHRALREAAANPYLSRFLGQVEHAVRRLPVTTFAHHGRPEEVANEHDAIVRAIEARDGEAAERAAKEHMHRAREIRLAMVLGT